MDTVLEYCDEYFFDSLYQKWLPSQLPGNVTTDMFTSEWQRDDVWRQSLSVFILVTVGGWLFYFSFALFSYYVFFDHDMMKHPKFLKNQVRGEIESAMSAIPGFALLTVPWFVGEINGYSLLYEGMPSSILDWAFLLISMPVFLFFTDFGIYWLHRWLHYPILYKHLHKPHHKWIVPTPFASHAFHPVDGYLQSVPYHLYVYCLPMHKWLYMFMFVFVNVWTVMIHDGNFISKSTIINTSAHHAVHHLYFNYNYGQYFTFWDKLGNSHRQPTDEQYDVSLRNNQKVMAQQAKEAETIEAETLRGTKSKAN
ncbi:c-5 sterol desaturase [Apophysomyces sp. BC1034]|nr:c-5 sterol desaturase [Apophysomyces sp. BC1015]KAG0182841.1 c-5 sterol desaturase [Apophysomyces sp. BC1021]KAG0194950.1 c-5 sterol desaturase [Apophysomyces sp. BC1034]